MDIQEENEQFLQIDVVKKIFSEHDIHWDKTSREWQFDFSVPDVEVNYFLGAWMAWQAAKAQAVPEGFVLVPKKPTEELLSKAIRKYLEVSDLSIITNRMAHLYELMIKEAQEQKA